MRPLKKLTMYCFKLYAGLSMLISLCLSLPITVYTESVLTLQLPPFRNVTKKELYKNRNYDSMKTKNDLKVFFYENQCIQKSLPVFAEYAIFAIEYILPLLVLLILNCIIVMSIHRQMKNDQIKVRNLPVLMIHCKNRRKKRVFFFYFLKIL
jgi:hypothetical protein